MPESAETILVLPFKHGPFWNFSYIVACGVTGRAVIIDPAWDVASMLAAARDHELDVITVFLTHGHSDHSSGTSAVVAGVGVKVIAHEAEVAEIRRTYAGPIDTLSEDTGLRLGAVDIRLVLTPGHTPGSLSLLIDGQLFTGDALHVGAIGRVGPEPGAIEQMFWTVAETFASLADDIVIRPGHDAGTRAPIHARYRTATDPGAVRPFVRCIRFVVGSVGAARSPPDAALPTDRSATGPIVAGVVAIARPNRAIPRLFGEGGIGRGHVGMATSAKSSTYPELTQAAVGNRSQMQNGGACVPRGHTWDLGGPGREPSRKELIFGSRSGGSFQQLHHWKFCLALEMVVVDCQRHFVLTLISVCLDYRPRVGEIVGHSGFSAVSIGCRDSGDQVAAWFQACRGGCPYPVVR